MEMPFFFPSFVSVLDLGQFDSSTWVGDLPLQQFLDFISQLIWDLALGAALLFLQ